MPIIRGEGRGEAQRTNDEKEENSNWIFLYILFLDIATSAYDLIQISSFSEIENAVSGYDCWDSPPIDY